MKNQSLLKPLLLVLLLSLPALTQICTISGNDDLLQSGSQQLTNSYKTTPSSREHRYQFNLNFQVPTGRSLQVAACTNFIYEAASSLALTATNGIDFSIWGGSGQDAGTGLLVLFINEDRSWTTIKVTFLASARSDFWLGSYKISPHFASSNPQGAVEVKQRLVDWAASSAQFTIVAELAGIKTASTALYFGFRAVTFDASTGVITTTFDRKSDPSVETITISYIIFNVSSPIKMTSFDPSTITSIPAYQFVGLDSINTASPSQIAYYGFSTTAQNGLTCLGSRCPSISCVTTQTCIASRGILTSTTCFMCAEGQTVSNGKCIVPVKCGSNQNYNGQKCVCNSGYIMVDNICYWGCGTNAYVFQNSCQCIPGYIFSTVQQQCIIKPVITCSANFIIQNDVCVCPAPYGLLGNQCVKCPANSFVNGQGKCVCNNGYELIKGSNVCGVICGANAVRDASTGQCVCVSGYYLQGTICVTCTNGLVWNGTACVCPVNQIKDSITGQCTTCTDASRTISNGLCVCANTHIPTNTSCIPCPTNQIYSSSEQKCICKSSYYLIGGVCRQCDSNAVYNAAQLTCICKDGYFGTFEKCDICHSSCKTCSGANSNQCKSCPTGYNLNNNNQCVIVTVPTPTCSAGSYLDSNGRCAACVANCILCYTANQCSSCAPGYTANSLNNQGTLITSCAENPLGVTSIISLRGNTLDAYKIYQGVAMSAMPSAILANGCNICSNLFTININSRYTDITTTIRYVPNSQYWFAITFEYPKANVPVPTFEYTVRINPIHANFFTSQDMAQVLRGAFDQDSFKAQMVTNNNNKGNETLNNTTGIPTVPPNLNNRGGALGGSKNNSTNSGELSKDIISQLFGNI